MSDVITMKKKQKSAIQSRAKSIGNCKLEAFFFSFAHSPEAGTNFQN